MLAVLVAIQAEEGRPQDGGHRRLPLVPTGVLRVTAERRQRAERLDLEKHGERVYKTLFDTI